MVIDRQARLVAVESWDDYFLFTLESPQIACQARPGQFLMIRVSETSQPLLRRPISLHQAQGPHVQIFFQVAGEGTRLLSMKKTGQQLDILGPLGNGFTIRPELRGNEVFCVGGGRGIAPLYYLARELRASGARPIIFYGGRSGTDLPLKDRLRADGFEVLISTDDGSIGSPGFVTSLVEAELKKRRPAYLYACGPVPMMEKLAEICRLENLKAEFSLESMMGCGFGACWGCVKKIRRNDQEKYLKVCQDGPVFSLEEVVWQESEHG
ncbi:MAG: dihydroorotate dehydrogenase electron transfer subunit [Candidatus Saccharicenans sp.]|nr:dihydroorotate dehydrogenase electron transfer subunit [Candidatus Saccharicenans sp.]